MILFRELSASFVIWNDIVTCISKPQLEKTFKLNTYMDLCGNESPDQVHTDRVDNFNNLSY